MKRFWMLAPLWLILCNECAPATNRAVTRTVLDLADALCIVGHADSDDATILQVCGLTRELIPVVRDLVSAQRAAASRSIACWPDGGK